jgi:hypothetical protein
LLCQAFSNKFFRFFPPINPIGDRFSPQNAQITTPVHTLNAPSPPSDTSNSPTDPYYTPNSASLSKTAHAQNQYSATPHPGSDSSSLQKCVQFGNALSTLWIVLPIPLSERLFGDFNFSNLFLFQGFRLKWFRLLFRRKIMPERTRKPYA